MNATLIHSFIKHISELDEGSVVDLYFRESTEPQREHLSWQALEVVTKCLERKLRIRNLFFAVEKGHGDYRPVFFEAIDDKYKDRDALVALTTCRFIRSKYGNKYDKLCELTGEEWAEFKEKSKGNLLATIFDPIQSYHSNWIYLDSLGKKYSNITTDKGQRKGRPSKERQAFIYLVVKVFCSLGLSKKKIQKYLYVSRPTIIKFEKRIEGELGVKFKNDRNLYFSKEARFDAILDYLAESMHLSNKIKLNHDIESQCHVDIDELMGVIDGMNFLYNMGVS